MNEEKLHQLIMPPSTLLKDALISLNNSGSQIILVVSEDGGLRGTLTDGDVRRALIKNFDLNTQISRIMNSTPLTVSNEVTKGPAQAILRQKKIKHLPILNDNRQLSGLHVLEEFNPEGIVENPLIIMAGGKGTRMMPLTRDLPKPMLEIGGKPIMQHIIEKARDCGFHQFFLTVNYRRDRIEQYFGDGEGLGVSIKYVYENKPLGTAGSLSLISDKITLPCVVTNGDVFSNINFRDIVEFHETQEADATMATRPFEMQNPYGTLEIDGLNIVGFDEKPIYRSYVNAGIYVLSPNALKQLSRNEPSDMPDLFSRLNKDGLRTVAFPMYEFWSDIGTPETLNTIRKKFSD